MKRACVVVMTMRGCPACESYLPRVRRMQQFYPRVDVHVLDAERPEHAALATRLGLAATPTTYVLRQPTGSVKWEGEVNDQTIAYAFQLAQRYS